MKLLPRSYGWKFFYASALVVVLAACLSITVFLLFALSGTFRRAGTITAVEVDTALHDLAPSMGGLWENRAAWPARFDRFRREHKFAPVRIIVLDAAGRVLYREGKDTPLDDLAGPGAARLTQAQVMALLAGKSHLENDTLYVVAPVYRRGNPVGILLGYIRPYSAVRPKSQPSSLLLLMLIPGLATLAASSLASFYLARGLRARAAALTQAIQAMAEGDYRGRLPFTDDDEIGRVAGAFNAMADRLAEARAREEALERLKQELVTN
ncbi:MAG: HAMP domain-containing protein, partial [Bacteroidota bacterium]